MTIRLEKFLAPVRVLNYKKGTFSEVRYCIQRKTGFKRAVKIIKKSQLRTKEEQRFLHEVNILKQLVSAFF